MRRTKKTLKVGDILQHNTDKYYLLVISNHISYFFALKSDNKEYFGGCFNVSNPTKLLKDFKLVRK